VQRIPFDRVARLILSVFAGIFTTLGALPALAGDPAVEKQAQALQTKAIEDDSLNTNYPEAIKKLTIAISKCAGDQCNPPLMGTLYRDLGVMLLLGGSVAEGRAAFAKALGFDASLELDPSYKNPTLEQQWSDTRKKAAVGEPRGGASGGAAATPDSGTGKGAGPRQPTGDFAHVPVPAQLVRTPQKASASTAQFVTAGAIGLAAVGTGVFFVVESNLWGDAAASLRKDLGAANACTHQPSPKCQQLDETAHAQHDAMTVAMTLFVGGGLLAAGALATLFPWPWEGARPAQTSAWIAPTEGGLTLHVARRLP
jgi:hypothetical protein